MSDQVTVRLLGPGDGPILDLLARDDAAFDVDGRGVAREALGPAAAEEYLADPTVLHWIAEGGARLVGTLICDVLRQDSGAHFEVLLYDIGVRTTHRRRGIGRLLVAAMDAWMEEHGVVTVWVLADNPAAERFYAACGFERDEPQPVSMSRTRGRAAT